MRRTRLSVTVLVLLAGGLTACSHDTRWCEFDATDQVVSDSYCQHNTPGYEWEHGSSSKKKSKIKKSSKTSSKTR